MAFKDKILGFNIAKWWGIFGFALFSMMTMNMFGESDILLIGTALVYFFGVAIVFPTIAKVLFVVTTYFKLTSETQRIVKEKSMKNVREKPFVEE